MLRLNIEYMEILNLYIGQSLALPMEKIDNGNLIGSINGTVVGGAGLVAGKMGLALYINGVDQYVDFGYQGDTCLGSISLCTHGWVTAFWLQPVGDRSGIIMDTGLYDYDRTLIYVFNLDLKTRFISPKGLWHVSFGLPSQDGWIHIVLTWQPCHGVKMYIDGRLVVIDTSSAMPTRPNADMPRFVVGSNNKYFKMDARMYKMTLDELCVWDAVMNDEEVMALYTVDARLNWDISHWHQDGVINGKHFCVTGPLWGFSPHKGQWRGVLICYLI